MHRALGLVVAAAFLVSGCNGAEDVGGSPSDAVAIADDFLTAIEANDTDTAWSLLYPANRNVAFGDDRLRFDDLVADIDLSGVDWTITSARADGDGRYHVSVAIDPEAIDEALGVFVQVARMDNVPTDGVMQVDIEPLFGSSGVLGG